MLALAPCSGSALTASEWFASQPAGDPSPLGSGAGLETRKVRIDDETRNALRASTPRVLALEVPEGGAILELPFGLLCTAGWACPGHRFEVRLRGDEGEARVLLDRTLRRPVGRWEVARLDLAAFAGRRIELQLRTRAIGPPGAAEPVPLWGDPLWIGGPPRPDRPPVLLVSLDALRADRLGAYGYDGAADGLPISPHLDALAREGARFANAVSQAPWTTPSHMSMFTSLHPSAHAVNEGWDELVAFQEGERGYRVLREGVVTLAAALRANGYQTRALTGGGTMAGELGFDRGFDVYRETAGRVSPRVLETLRAWFEDARAGTPLFVFLHTFEIHSPYTHPEIALARLDEAERAKLLDAVRPVAFGPDRSVERLQAAGLYRAEVTSALYDGGIRYTDAFLGDVFAAFAEAGLADRGLVVVTSDHGEEFADHDPHRIYGAHCYDLYDELVNVPLLVRQPGVVKPGRVVQTPVQLVDLAPTLLELLSLPPLPGAQGRSLAGLLRRDTRAEPRPAFSEAVCEGPEWKAVRQGAQKYIAAYEPVGGERSGIPGARIWEKLFDLGSDPGERHDLLAQQPALAERLRQILEEHLSAVTRDRPRGLRRILSPAAMERLRALGYVE